MSFLVRKLSLLLAALCLSTGASAEWRVAETKHFRVYSDGSEKALVAYARQLERFDWLLRLMTGAGTEREMPPLDVYMVRSQAKLRALADLPRDVGGFYHAASTGTAAFSVRVNDADDTALDILLHEYGHHFMMFHFPYVYPSWYVEGFAEYFSTADVKTDNMTMGRASQNRAAWLTYGNWIDARVLLTADAWSMKKRDDVAMFYAQSWLATHYMLRDPQRSQQLSAYLKRLSVGESLEAAFEPAFGIDMKTFNRQLNAYMKGKITYTKLTIKPGQVPEPPVSVSALPPAAETLLLPYAMLKARAGDTEAADTLVAGLRRDALRYPDDPWTAEVIAAVEAEFGDAAQGRKLLRPLMEARPDDAELNYLMGRSHMRSAEDGDVEANHAQARRHFTRAFKTRPHHYQTLYNYVRAQPDPRRPDVVTVLAEARALAPQVSEINVALAALLVETGEFERARNILGAMMMNPHSPPSDYVVDLLQRARAGAGTQTVSPEAAR